MTWPRTIADRLAVHVTHPAGPGKDPMVYQQRSIPSLHWESGTLNRQGTIFRLGG